MTRRRLVAWWRRRRMRPVRMEPFQDPVFEKLEQLEEARRSGVLSEEDYQWRRARLMGHY